MKVQWYGTSNDVIEISDGIIYTVTYILHFHLFLNKKYHVSTIHFYMYVGLLVTDFIFISF